VSEKEIDQVLVERVQKGDKAAFELLVSKYHRKILRLISRLVRDPAEVEDVAQDAFIKAYRALPQFRGNRPFIRGCTGLRSIRQELPCDPRAARTDFDRSRC
jgi:DNA-directed RNA polymerase specialized sigma subunit, sigma24 homolog